MLDRVFWLNSVVFSVKCVIVWVMGMIILKIRLCVYLGLEVFDE